MLLLQLAYDLKQISTLEVCSMNTDAIAYMIDDEYKEQAHTILHNWEKLTGLELEEDNIVKIVMRDVNNYVSINQIGDNDYEVHYKGGELTRGEHKFKWNKDKKIFEYSYMPSLKSNSMSIVSEAILKFLLFDTPIKETIEKCDNIWRYQIISHLGSTYEKCVQELPNGDITLNRNNRIYAGLKPSGVIVKIKPDGRRDSLANCPPNPIVDNGNKCTIDDINKEWYIEFAQEKANDFLGIPRLESLKKEELLERANQLGLEIDKKIKKADLIELIKNKKKSEVNIMATKKEETKEVTPVTFADERTNDAIKVNALLFTKIDKLRQFIRSREFVLDEELPSNLGGGEYYSIGQLYDAIQEGCLAVGLDFSFDVTDVLRFDAELVKPSGKLPIHVATVMTKATLTDIDTGVEKVYYTIGQGSDTIDKAVSGAGTLAFRQWFMKNFSPKGANDNDETPNETPKSAEPKTPVYIPETKKEEIKEKVVEEKQQEQSDDEDVKIVCENIMKVRELTGNEEYGKTSLEKLMSGKLSSAEILEMDLKVKNKLEKIGA